MAVLTQIDKTYHLDSISVPVIKGANLIVRADCFTVLLGANLTALLSDAAVAHLEWSCGSEPDLRSRALPALALPAGTAARNRFVSGVTYTTLGKLSVTAEYQYNGFGLDQSNWAALGANQLAYLRGALRL